MNAIAQVEHESEQDRDLLTLVRILWRYRWLIVVIVGLFGVGSVVMALLATPIFRADVVVTAVRDEKMGGVGGLASQLGGLASLAGVNLADGDQVKQSQAFLQSRHAAEEFIERNDLLDDLFPEPSNEPITLWKGVRKMKEGVVFVREDQRKAVTTVSVEWIDPAVAAKWANDYVALVNELLRKRAIDEAERNIAYLKDQIARTEVVELQRVMYNLVENETKTLMLANARPEYAFSVIDPAVAPEIRVRPKRTMMVLFGGMLGFMTAAMLAFAHNAYAQYRTRIAGVTQS